MWEENFLCGGSCVLTLVIVCWCDCSDGEEKAKDDRVVLLVSVGASLSVVYNAACVFCAHALNLRALCKYVYSYGC